MLAVDASAASLTGRKLTAVSIPLQLAKPAFTYQGEAAAPKSRRSGRPTGVLKTGCRDRLQQPQPSVEVLKLRVSTLAMTVANRE